METKTALLDSAETAARMRGFDGFSYADLAKDVGIRKASIHHHFPTKADLALALLTRYCETFKQKLQTIRAEHVSGGAQLSAYISAYRDALDGGEMVCLCVSFSAGRDSLAEPVLAQLMQFHEDSLVWLMAVFERAAEDGSIENIGRPIAEASACLALVEGAQLMARAAKTIELFDMAVTTTLARIH